PSNSSASSSRPAPVAARPRPRSARLLASGVPASSSAWKRDLDEVRGCCPAAFSPFERAPVDQHPQDLLDEERVSLGPLENACTRLVPNLVDVQQLVDEPAGLPSTEWLQVESGLRCRSRARPHGSWRPPRAAST